MPEPKKDITILIVDDDPDMRRLITFDFKKRGFKILEASGGNEAFALMKTHKVDLILTDIRMPEGDGIELLEKMHSLKSPLPPVILVSAYSELPKKEALDRGAIAVFSKPYDRKELMNKVLATIELT